MFVKSKKKEPKKNSAVKKSSEVILEKTELQIFFTPKEFVSFKRNANVFSQKIQISAITKEGFFILPHELGQKLNENKIKLYSLDKNQRYILASKNELFKI